MRKQYYFKPSGPGFDAWDVKKLIRKAASLPVIQWKLGEIKEIDENYWYQGKNDVPSCRSIVSHLQLIIDADLEFPVILSVDGRVMDGMHRVLKALIQGRETIKAVRFEEEVPPDFTDVLPGDLTC